MRTSTAREERGDLGGLADQIGRHRWRALVIPVVIGLASSLFSAVPAAAGIMPPCPQAFVINVRGSGETESTAGGNGTTALAVASKFKSRLLADPDRAAQWAGMSHIDYKAVKVGAGWVSYPLVYQDSVKDGVKQLDREIKKQLESRCAYLYLVGHSQGADVIGTVFQTMSSEEQARIGGVALLADPGFNKNDAKYVAVGDYEARNGVNPRVDLKSPERLKVRSYCMKGDPVCQWDGTSGANYKRCDDTAHSPDKENCPHTRYTVKSANGRDWTYKGSLAQYRGWTYTDIAADWLFKSVPPLIANPEKLPDATVGKAYDQQLKTLDNRAGSWSVKNLPSWLKLKGSHLYGVPSGTGTAYLGVTFVDAAGRKTFKPLDVGVVARPAAECPAGSVQSGLTNMGFEAGLSGWKLGLQTEATEAVGADGFTSPNEGSTMARLGRSQPSNAENQPIGDNVICQDFTVTKAEERFAFNVFTYDYTGFDRFAFDVIVTNPRTGEKLASYERDSAGSGTDLKSSGWRGVKLNLADQIGKTVRLTFRSGGTKDELYAFWVYLDSAQSSFPDPLVMDAGAD